MFRYERSQGYSTRLLRLQTSSQGIYIATAGLLHAIVKRVSHGVIGVEIRALSEASQPSALTIRREYRQHGFNE